MAKREIIKIPDPVLKTPSQTVPAVTDEVRALLDEMLETMYDAPGIGLAAVQIGIPKRLVVIDVSGRGEEDEEEEGEVPERRPLFLINPEIVWSSQDEQEYEEGCLSIPDVTEPVSRPTQVRVRFLDRDGVEQEMHCEGLLATCVQHEVDHTNGILFIDHISRLKRDRIVKRFVKARRQGEAAE